MSMSSTMLGSGGGWQQLLLSAFADSPATDRQSAVGESCSDAPTLEKAIRPPRPLVAGVNVTGIGPSAAPCSAMSSITAKRRLQADSDDESATSTTVVSYVAA